LLVLNGELGPDDRLQPRLHRRLVETRCAVDTVGVEDREGGIAERGRPLDERFGQRGTP
jgi:hypothetical protein